MNCEAFLLRLTRNRRDNSACAGERVSPSATLDGEVEFGFFGRGRGWNWFNRAAMAGPQAILVAWGGFPQIEPPNRDCRTGGTRRRRPPGQSSAFSILAGVLRAI